MLARVAHAALLVLVLAQAVPAQDGGEGPLPRIEQGERFKVSPGGRLEMDRSIGRNWFPGGGTSVCFDPDGKCILAPSEGTLRTWDFGEGRQVREFRPRVIGVRVVESLSRARWSPDGGHVAAIEGSYGMLWIWDRQGERSDSISRWNDTRTSPGAGTGGRSPSGFAGAGTMERFES